MTLPASCANARSRRTVCALLLLTSVVLLQGCAGHAHPFEVPRVLRQPDWMSLMAVPPGTSITVTGPGGKHVGQFEIASDRDLTMTRRAERVTLGRSDICQVLTRERHIGRHAKAGAIKGGAFGALLGAAVAETSKGSFMLMLSFGWAALGAIGGTIDGAVEPVTVVLYRVC